MPPFEYLLSRRSLIGGAAGLGLASSAGVVSARAAGAPNLSAAVVDMRPLSEPAVQLQTLMRMMASLDGEDCMWFYRGRMFAQVGDAAPVPLCGLIGAETYWPILQADGSYVLSASTFSYPTELDSEDTLQSLRNPFTGANDAPVANTYRRDDTTRITQVGMIHAAGMAPDPHRLLFTEIGDTLLMQHDVGQPQLAQPHRELSSMMAPLAEFRDPSVRRFSALSSLTFISRWPKWMRMGERPGHVIWAVASKKLKSPDELPASYLARIRAEHPTLVSARPGTPGASETVY